MHLEILLDLGQPDEPRAATAPKSYRLSLASPGQPAQVFATIPYVDPQFSQFTWFGFSSVGQPGSAFYVDNVRLELAEK